MLDRGFAADHRLPGIWNASSNLLCR